MFTVKQRDTKEENSVEIKTVQDSKQWLCNHEKGVVVNQVLKQHIGLFEVFVTVMPATRREYSPGHENYFIIFIRVTCSEKYGKCGIVKAYILLRYCDSLRRSQVIYF